MDTLELIDILRASIDSNQRVQAEEKLEQIQKDNGFSHLLLQVVMRNDVPIPVRQYGAVYLKNFITSGWEEKEAEDTDPTKFTIHEQDKAAIRDLIVDAVIQAPDIIKVPLCVCLKTIAKYDYPSRWPEVFDKINVHLDSSDSGSWMGALLCLYNLIKNYENHPNDERGPLIQAMKLLLPKMYGIIMKLKTDQSAESILIQKQVLKCYYSLVKNSLNFDLMSGEVFTRWMEVLKLVLGQPVPCHTSLVDEDKQLELPWWKIKKWAVHTLIRLFEKYGSPLHVEKEYIMFSTWYLTTFTSGVLEVFISIMELFQSDIYVSPIVLKGILDYMCFCVKQTQSWRLLQPYMFDVIQQVIFPILFYKDADEVLWNTDPYEYIEKKFNVFKDTSLTTSAQELLLSACKRRNYMFLYTMEHCWHILKNQTGEFGPRENDGTLHVLGVLNNLIMTKKSSKSKITLLLRDFVYPSFHSQMLYSRARACWVLQYFAGSSFRREGMLERAVYLTAGALLHDSELPIRVEAALAIRALLASQERARGYLLPYVQEVTKKLLQITHDSIELVLRQVVTSFAEELIPMACEITDHLATNFSRAIDTDSGYDEKGITVRGLLTVMNTVASAMENNSPIMAQIETTILRVIRHILRNNINEHYEAAISLMSSLTANTISEDMWKALKILYSVFEKDGLHYFTDMMPVLYNYVTVDTNAFVSNRNHVLLIFHMAEGVLNSETKDDSKVYAAKLLEILVLQCSGKIDNCLEFFVLLVFKKLSKNISYLELRIMLLQVLIAVMYCNPHILFDIMRNIQESIQESVPNVILDQLFIKQWIRDTSCFLGTHDHKISLLGICTLLDFGGSRPNLDDVIPELLPVCLFHFEGLNSVYDALENPDSNTSNVNVTRVPEDSSSDEDTEDDEESDEEEDDNLRLVARLVELSASENENSSTDQDPGGENAEAILDEKLLNAVSCYKTPIDIEDSEIDVYIKFKHTFLAIYEHEPSLYHALMSSLDDLEQDILNGIFVRGDQRQAQQFRRNTVQSGSCGVGSSLN